MQQSLRIIFLALAVLTLAACSGNKNTRDDAAAVDQGSSQTADTSGVDQGGAAQMDPLDDPDNILSKRVILFDFDKAVVKDEYRALVEAHARYVAEHPSARVTLEGHADERGTREYNLGLGERRGNAVAKLMQALGASAGQINVVSYGEERPVALCHAESCWYQNRRVEIVYTSR